MQHSPIPRPRPTVRPRPALAAVMALAFGWLAPPPTAAHAELIQAMPTPNATLADAPGEVTIAFSEPIDEGSAFIDLLDSRQRRVDGVGEVSVDAGGRLARASLPSLDPGPYTVSYQVVSAVDGHATVGTFAFLVDPTGAAAPPVAPVTATSPSVDALTVAARWAALAALLVAFGSVVGWWHARAPGGVGAAPWRLIGGAAIVGAAGIAGYLWLAARPIAAALEDRSVIGWLDPAAAFGWSPFAVAMRIALLAALVAGLLALTRPPRGRGTTAVVALLLAVALAGMSAAGHAAASGGPLFALFDWLHLVAVGAWLGALPALLVIGRRVGALGDVLRRHGGLALVAAPVVVLTGLANSPLVLGGGRDLVASDYGNLVLAKALLLSVALGIGAVNHFAVRGRGRAATGVLVAVELAVAAVAVGAAATMVTIQPAAARQPILTAPPVNPAHLFGEVAGARVHVTVNPPAPGPQTIQAWLTDLDTGLPVSDAAEVAVELVAPDGEDGATVPLDPTEVPGVFVASGRLLPEEGTWAITVAVTREDEEAERIGFEVPVARQAPAEPVPQPDTGVGVPPPIALTWSLLPRGPAAWLPALAALAGLVVAGWLRPSAARTVIRAALVAAVAVTGTGAASRTVVDAANAPVAGALEPPPATHSSAAEIARGEGIYRANCASCHGIDGAGDGPIRTSPAAGSLPDAVATSSADDLSYRIAYGVAGTPMPAFAGTLTRDERWALVGYLRSRWAEP